MVPTLCLVAVWQICSLVTGLPISLLNTQIRLILAKQNMEIYSSGCPWGKTVSSGYCMLGSEADIEHIMRIFRGGEARNITYYQREFFRPECFSARCNIRDVWSLNRAIQVHTPIVHLGASFKLNKSTLTLGIPIRQAYWWGKFCSTSLLCLGSTSTFYAMKSMTLGTLWEQTRKLRTLVPKKHLRAQQILNGDGLTL